jgi:hypothetical protein
VYFTVFVLEIHYEKLHKKHQVAASTQELVAALE